MGAALLLGGAPRLVSGQERGAAALGESVAALGVNTRVLVIGAHPDDEDAFLIAWLSRGRHVRTGYLSLTRGDGGQNLIGNELGEALGVIRTEELLAARRVDGGEQYFTRAYDFGYSKDTADTFRHWPKDSILGDVVRVVREMRPHVIVAMWSGTSRDGHGHHQAAGLLAREAYELAGDASRFPVARFGAPWTPLKFYRAARFNPQAGTLAIDVGEYSPLLGRTFADIARQSLAQHKSQGFGGFMRPGGTAHVRREASRVNESTAAASERTLFDGIDTSWARFRRVESDSARAALDSLPDALAAALASFAPLDPASMVPRLARVSLLAGRLKGQPDADLAASVVTLHGRLDRALQLAAGVEAEALVSRPVFPAGRPVTVTITTRNRGVDRVEPPDSMRPNVVMPWSAMRRVPAGSVVTDSGPLGWTHISQPEWLERPRTGAMFTRPSLIRDEAKRPWHPTTKQILLADGTGFDVAAPVMFRDVDPLKGEVRRLAAAVPAISVTIDAARQYAPANAPIDRTIEVRLTSADTAARTAEVILALPDGLIADGTNRVAVLGGYGATAVIPFHLRGRLPRGEHRLSVTVESHGETFTSGYTLIDYDHIEPQRLYRAATLDVSAIDVRVPAALRVAYVTGVSDNVAPALQQLGVNVTIIPARDIARANLSRFSTLVIGPRAYDANPELVAASARVLDFARSGGTVVAQYGQYEMTQPGIMPYSITISRPHDRVSHEDAPVAILDSTARVLVWPNRIGLADFDGWVQERSLYMPRTFDPNYRPVIATGDPGEPANRGGILVAPLGRGRYVYTSLAFFRQLPAGVPGAARLFVNLLSAGLSATPNP